MEARKPSSARGWLVTLVGMLAAVAIAINMFKVPPTMGLLMADLGIGPALGGWLMTVPTVTGLVLALPSGGLTDKFGPKKVGLFAILSAAVGSLIGSFAPNIELLLFSRFVEGLSFALIGVAVPAIIALWFLAREERRAHGHLVGGAHRHARHLHRGEPVHRGRHDPRRGRTCGGSLHRAARKRPPCCTWCS